MRTFNKRNWRNINIFSLIDKALDIRRTGVTDIGVKQLNNLLKMNGTLSRILLLPFLSYQQEKEHAITEIGKIINY